MSHIWVNKLSVIGSDKGQGQAIIKTNAGLLLIGQFGTHFGEILIEINIFPFMQGKSHIFWKV